MRRNLMIGCLLVLGIFLAVFLTRPQPDSPLELHLELARQRWHTSENLWYRLTVKNVGRKTITIRDRFWKEQGQNSVNRSEGFGTFLQIFDPEGKEVRYDRIMAHGIHGERQFWVNDCGGGKACQGSDDNWKPLRLKPGESFTATPSMVAPVRQGRTSMDDPGDPRALPEIPKGWSKERIEALKGDWKKDVEGIWLMGDAGYRADPKAVPEPRPAGFRVTEGYDLDRPGKYRIQAVCAPFGIGGFPDFDRYGVGSHGYPVSPKDHPEEWKSMAKNFTYYSNPVDFEVVRSTYSHMYPEGFPELTPKEHARRRRQNIEMQRESDALWKTIEKKLKEQEKPEKHR